MGKFHENIQMHPTACQMQIINRYLPFAKFSDCEITREGGTHFHDGRDFDGTFCVHIYRKGRFVWKDNRFSKEH